MLDLHEKIDGPPLPPPPPRGDDACALGQFRRAGSPFLHIYSREARRERRARRSLPARFLRVSNIRRAG